MNDEIMDDYSNDLINAIVDRDDARVALDAAIARAADGGSGPMKISELKPCSVCGGPIAPLFYRVTVEQIMFDSTATNQVLGLNMMFGGNALRLAEAMAPNDDVTYPLQTNTVALCQECATTIPLAEILLGVDEQEAPAP